MKNDSNDSNVLLIRSAFEIRNNDTNTENQLKRNLDIYYYDISPKRKLKNLSLDEFCKYYLKKDVHESNFMILKSISEDDALNKDNLILEGLVQYYVLGISSLNFDIRSICLNLIRNFSEDRNLKYRDNLISLNISRIFSSLINISGIKRDEFLIISSIIVSITKGIPYPEYDKISELANFLRTLVNFDETIILENCLLAMNQLISNPTFFMNDVKLFDIERILNLIISKNDLISLYSMKIVGKYLKLNEFDPIQSSSLIEFLAPRLRHGKLIIRKTAFSTLKDFCQSNMKKKAFEVPDYIQKNIIYSLENDEPEVIYVFISNNKLQIIASWIIIGFLKTSINILGTEWDREILRISLLNMNSSNAELSKISIIVLKDFFWYKNWDDCIASKQAVTWIQEFNGINVLENIYLNSDEESSVWAEKILDFFQFNILC